MLFFDHTGIRIAILPAVLVTFSSPLAKPALADSTTKSGPIKYEEKYDKGEAEKRRALAAVMKDGYVNIKIETKLFGASASGKPDIPVTDFKLRCSNAKLFGSHFLYALGLSFEASPPISSVSDDKSTIGVGTVIPLAYVVDLDPKSTPNCSSDYKRFISFGAFKVSGTSPEITATLKRQTAKTFSTEFIPVFMEVFTALVPFTGAVGGIQKLVLNDAQQQSVPKLQKIFETWTKSDSTDKAPDNWSWKSYVGRRFWGTYTRTFSSEPPQHRNFVVEFIAEPVVSVFDADYEIKDAKIIRKYNLEKDILEIQLGPKGTNTETINTLIQKDAKAIDLLKDLKGSDTTGPTYGEKCQELHKWVKSSFSLIDEDAAIAMYEILRKTAYMKNADLRKDQCGSERMVKLINRLLQQSGSPELLSSE